MYIDNIHDTCIVIITTAIKKVPSFFPTDYTKAYDCFLNAGKFHIER